MNVIKHASSKQFHVGTPSVVGLTSVSAAQTFQCSVRCKSRLSPGKQRQRKAYEAQKKKLQKGKMEAEKLTDKIKRLDLDIEKIQNPVDLEDALEFGHQDIEDIPERSSIQAGLMTVSTNDLLDYTKAKLDLPLDAKDDQVVEQVFKSISTIKPMSSQPSQDLESAMSTINPITPRTMLSTLAKLTNASKVEEAFRELIARGYQCDVVDYSIVLTSYAKSGNLVRVQELLKEMTDKDIAPNDKTFSAVITAQLENGKLDMAFKTLESMKVLKISPDVVIYTQLIKGCIKARQFKRAWTTYEHLRTEWNIEPDMVLYNEMMNLSAKEGEPEKALDLFTEMTGHAQIVPNESSYANVILALSTDARYHERAIELFHQFYQIGKELDPEFDPSIETWTRVMRCVDLPISRRIWNHLVTRHVLDNARAPSAPQWGEILAAYKHCINDWHQHTSELVLKAEANAPLEDREKPTVDVKVGSFENWLARRHIDLEMLPSNEQVVCPPNPTIQPMYKPSWLTSPSRTIDELPKYTRPETLPPQSTLLSFTLETPTDKLTCPLPLLTSQLNSPDLMLAEAEALTDWFFTQARKSKDAIVTKGSQNGPMLDETSLFKEYLEMYIKDDLLSLSLLDRFNAQKQLDSSILTMPIRFIVLSKLQRYPALYKQHGEDFWQDLLKFDEEREALLTNQTPAEKERQRDLENRGRAMWNKLYSCRINALANLRDPDQAMKVFEEHPTFRFPGYLPSLTKQQVGAFLKLARELREDGDRRYIKHLNAYIAQEEPDVLTEVQRHLKQKKISPHWWGWKAIGVSNSDLRKFKSRMN